MVVSVEMVKGSCVGEVVVDGRNSTAGVIACSGKTDGAIGVSDVLQDVSKSVNKQKILVNRDILIILASIA